MKFNHFIFAKSAKSELNSDTGGKKFVILYCCFENIFSFPLMHEIHK